VTLSRFILRERLASMPPMGSISLDLFLSEKCALAVLDGEGCQSERVATISRGCPARSSGLSYLAKPLGGDQRFQGHAVRNHQSRSALLDEMLLHDSHQMKRIDLMPIPELSKEA
jgi:hypothetical protein